MLNWCDGTTAWLAGERCEWIKLSAFHHISHFTLYTHVLMTVPDFIWLILTQKSASAVVRVDSGCWLCISYVCVCPLTVVVLFKVISVWKVLAFSAATASSNVISTSEGEIEAAGLSVLRYAGKTMLCKITVRYRTKVSSVFYIHECKTNKSLNVSGERISEQQRETNHIQISCVMSCLIKSS